MAPMGRDDRVTSKLLATALSHRQWEVLDLLFEHPLLSAEEIAAALEVEADSAERYLSPLRRSGCVAETFIPSHFTRFRLSECGLHLVADAHHLPLRSVAVPARGHEGAELQRGVAALLVHIDHTADAYGFFAALLCAAQAERAAGREHRLIWWVTGLACARRYRHQNRWHNLRPDGAGEYRIGGRRVRFWLEWDRGTMGPRDLEAKFAAYACYVESREWPPDDGSRPPLLLVVTLDGGQEGRIVRAIDSTPAGESALTIRTTLLPLLAAYGPLAAIWHEWKQHGQRAPDDPCIPFS